MPSPAKNTSRQPAKTSATPAPAEAVPARKAPAKPVPHKPAAAKPAAPQPSTPGAQGSMSFCRSEALQTRVHAVLGAIEAQPDDPQHGAALADLVNELIDAGVDHYFLRGLKHAEVNFVVMQSARLGLSGAMRLLSSVSRQFILRLEPKQMLLVVAHLRSLN
jgi:hypothetical protein